MNLPQRKDCFCACHDPVDGNDICKHVTACCRPNDSPNSAHPLTADRFARYEAALREIATIMPSAAGAIAENALKDDGVIL